MVGKTLSLFNIAITTEIHGIQSVTNASLANTRGVRLTSGELGMDRKRISGLQWAVSTLTAVASATADFPPCPSIN